MSKYYYLVSQLPFLKFGERDGFSRDFFLGEARKWLSARDFGLLSRVDINDFSERPVHPEVWRRYKEFEFNLRKDIFRLRQAQDLTSASVSVMGALRGNPLEVETQLLALRWQFIDEEEVDCHFDLSFLILYFLKIQISEVLNTFNKDKGIALFDRVCEVHL